MAKKPNSIGDPIDLTPWLSGEKRVRDRTHLIGVELEGGWNTPHRDIPITRDASVQGLENDFLGEIPSPAMALAQLEGWLKTYYPAAVNATCGFHIHLSFKDALCYQRLMDARFPATVLAEFKKWGKVKGIPEGHPLWNRLTNGTTHCQHVFDPEGQVSNIEKDYHHTRPGNRYSVINYCWGRYQTVECRVLPMFDNPATAFEAAKHYVSISNAFLVAVAKKEGKILAKVDADVLPIKDVFMGGILFDQGDRRDLLLWDDI